MQKETNTEYIKRNLYNIGRLEIFSLQLLVFFMLFFPRVQQEIKIVVLIILIILNIIKILRNGKVIVNKKPLNFLIVYLIYALSSVVLGFLKLNPGSFDFFKINIVYMVVLYFVFANSINVINFEKILKTIIIAGNFIAIYTILLLLVNIDIWPEAFFIKLDETSNVGIHEGYTHITNTNLSMMMFICPMIIMLNYYKYSSKLISKKLLIFSEMLVIFSILISGRRILWLSFALPLIFIVLNKLRKRTLRSMTLDSLIILLSGIVLYILNRVNFFSIENFINRFIDAFEGGKENVRIEQMIALWNGFEKNPIFGSGAGIGVIDSVRSTSTPWVYEASYNLVLYNSGSIGFLIYACALIYLLYSILKKAKRNNSKIGIAIAVSYIMILIGNATNPYFSSSFDFLIFFFIPILYLCTPENKGGDITI